MNCIDLNFLSNLVEYKAYLLIRSIIAYYIAKSMLKKENLNFKINFLK